MILALLCLLTGSTGAFAQDARIGAIEITGAWIRATLAPGQPSAAYFTLHNTGATPEKLTAIASPRAGMVDLHQSVMSGTTMTMADVGALEIPAGASIALKPGGYHAMLMGVAQPFKIGENVPLTLTFEHAGAVTLSVPVKPLSAAQ